MLIAINDFTGEAMTLLIEAAVLTAWILLHVGIAYLLIGPDVRPARLRAELRTAINHYTEKP